MSEQSKLALTVGQKMHDVWFSVFSADVAKIGNVELPTTTQSVRKEGSYLVAVFHVETQSCRREDFAAPAAQGSAMASLIGSAAWKCNG